MAKCSEDRVQRRNPAPFPESGKDVEILDINSEAFAADAKNYFPGGK